jgi:hypothetical protein
MNMGQLKKWELAGETDVLGKRLTHMIWPDFDTADNTKLGNVRID